MAKPGFHPVVQLLVWVESVAVGWHVKQLNLHGMFLDPFEHLDRLVNPEIVHDQEDLALGRLDQPSEKLDELIGLHASFVDHEPDVILIADSGLIASQNVGFFAAFARLAMAG